MFRKLLIEKIINLFNYFIKNKVFKNIIKIIIKNKNNYLKNSIIIYCLVNLITIKVIKIIHYHNHLRIFKALKLIILIYIILILVIIKIWMIKKIY